MEVNTFGEICNKNILLMNKKSADNKNCFNRNSKFLGFCYEIVEILLVHLTAHL
jgi:hypothetical protein